MPDYRGTFKPIKDNTLTVTATDLVDAMKKLSEARMEQCAPHGLMIEEVESKETSRVSARITEA